MLFIQSYERVLLGLLDVERQSQLATAILSRSANLGSLGLDDLHDSESASGKLSNSSSLMMQIEHALFFRPLAAWFSR